MPKSTDSDAAAADPLAFEDALSQLEALVREMESDQMPLEELIEHYEKGTTLSKACQSRLDEAQGRIEIIRKNRKGETVIESFDEQHSSSSTLTTEEDESAAHGELF